MLVADDGRAMAIDIITHRDALRHTARRVVVAVSLTVVLTWSSMILQFGTDPDATVRAGFVTKSGIMIGIIVSAVLTAGLTYRSALVMRELALARAELLRISCTDQLTGLLNRRGFDEAAVAACRVDGYVSVLMSSGSDWTDRMRRLAARAPNLDIFSNALVLRDNSGWQITDKGRQLLASLEAPIPAAQDREQTSGPDVAIPTAPRPVQPELRLVVDNTRTSQSGRGPDETRRSA